MAAAEAAAAAGADLLGFVFAPSVRRVSVATALAISRAVPGIGRVGVFVNAPLSQVWETAARCRLDFVQLHGDESPAYCAAVGYPVIKAVPMTPTGPVWDVAAYRVAWLLFDTAAPGQRGGTGRRFAWSLLDRVRSASPAPFFLAGGLTPDNVAQAIRQVRPDGVDVSGGVETNGEKDPVKIAAFIRAARAAARGESGA